MYVKEPAKIILFGEHFVVHGSCAVSFAIDRFVHVNISLAKSFNLTIKFYDGSMFSYDIDSDVDIVKYARFLMDKLKIPQKINVNIQLDFPISAGLGSSASMAAALAKALSMLKYGYIPSFQTIYDLANEFEKRVHGNPSGIDLHTILTRKIILYDGKSKRILDSTINENLKVIIADTLDRRKTGVLVSNVAKIKSRYVDLFNKLVDISNVIAKEGFKILKYNGAIEELGKLMMINHGLLYSIGVSTKRIDNLIHTAIENGALGAKLTGAGGGGCIIALAREEDTPYVVQSLKENGADVMVVKPYYEV